MRKCRKFGLENFTISVKNALGSSWLLTKGSQGEAKGETKDFNGSQEAKGKPKVKQRISMEAKKPRALEETLIFIRETILLK